MARFAIKAYLIFEAAGYGEALTLADAFASAEEGEEAVEFHDVEMVGRPFELPEGVEAEVVDAISEMAADNGLVVSVAQEDE